MPFRPLDEEPEKLETEITPKQPTKVGRFRLLEEETEIAPTTPQAAQPAVTQPSPYKYDPARFRPKGLVAPKAEQEIGTLEGIANAARDAFDSSRQALDIVGEVTPEEAQNIAKIEFNKQSRKLAPGYDEYQKASGFDAVLAFAKNPIEVTSNIVAEGLAGSLPALGAGLAAGGVGAAIGAPTGIGAPIGFTAGQVAGTFAGSLATEYGSKILEEMQSEGVDLTKPESIQGFFENEEAVTKARDKAISRGIPVAAFDAISAGIGGKLGRVIGKQFLTKTGEAAAELGVQAGLGGGGEVAGALVAGEPIEGKAVFGEIIGEAGPGAAEIITGRMADRAARVKAEEEKKIKAAAQLSDNLEQNSAPLTAAAVKSTTSTTIEQDKLAAQLEEQLDADEIASQVSGQLAVTKEPTAAPPETTAQIADRLRNQEEEVEAKSIRSDKIDRMVREDAILDELLGIDPESNESFSLTRSEKEQRLNPQQRAEYSNKMREFYAERLGQVAAPTITPAVTPAVPTAQPPTTDATQEIIQPEGVRQEPQDRVEVRPTEEAGVGDSILRAERGQEEGQVVPTTEPTISEIPPTSELVGAEPAQPTIREVPEISPIVGAEPAAIVEQEPVAPAESAVEKPAAVSAPTRNWELYSEELRGDLESFSAARGTGRIDYDLMDVADRFVEFAKNDTSGKPLSKLVTDFGKTDFDATTAQIKKLRTSVKSVEQLEQTAEPVAPTPVTTPPVTEVVTPAPEAAPALAVTERPRIEAESPATTELRNKIKQTNGQDRRSVIQLAINDRSFFPAAIDAAETGKPLPSIERAFVPDDVELPDRIDTTRIRLPEIKVKSPEEAASPMISYDDRRWVLGGVYFDSTNNMIVATDGRALVAIPKKITKDKIIAARNIKETTYQKAIKKGQQIDGNYPNWKATVPTYEKDVQKVDIDIDDARRASTVLDSINKTFNEKVGDSVIVFNNARFNPKYILSSINALSESGAKSITAQIRSEADPLLLTGDNGAIAVVMPMRVTGRIAHQLKSKAETRPPVKKYNTQALLNAAKPFSEYGSNYNRNIAASYERLKNAIDKGLSESTTSSIAEELEIRLNKFQPKAVTPTPSPEAVTPAAAPTSAAPEAAPTPAGISVGNRIKLGKSPQTYTIEEVIPQSATERELGEQYYSVKNERTGEVQTVEAGDLRQVKGKGARKLFAGERAEIPQFMRDSLDAARAMAAAGKTTEEIRAVTGWFPGMDGKMRWEIPDQDARIVTPQTKNRLQFNLSDILQHESLYAAYPEARNIPIKFQTSTEYAGMYEPASGVISIGEGVITDKSDAKLSTLLHEIQHWIQNKEGFAAGTNIRTEASKLKADKRVTDAQYELQKAWAAVPPLERVDVKNKLRDSYGSGNLSTLGLDKNDESSLEKLDLWEVARTGYLLEPNVEKALRNLFEVRDAVYAGSEKDSARQAYLRNAGEIESRDVEARRTLNPEQRKAVAPYASQNIATEDAIIIQESEGAASEVSPTPEGILITPPDQQYTFEEVFDVAYDMFGGEIPEGFTIVNDSKDKDFEFKAAYIPESGEIIVNLAYLNRNDDIRDTITHELGHYIYGDPEFRAAFDQFIASLSPEARAELDAYVDTAYNKETGEIRLEEKMVRAFVDQFINEENAPAWRSMLDAIKRFLNKLGFKFNISDRDAISVFTAALDRYKAGEAISREGGARKIIDDLTAMDAEYLAAVEEAKKTGDFTKVQRMVDDAAKKAGYNIGPVPHGTTSGPFNEFRTPAYFGSGASMYAQADSEIVSWKGKRDTVSSIKPEEIEDELDTATGPRGFDFDELYNGKANGRFVSFGGDGIYRFDGLNEYGDFKYTLIENLTPVRDDSFNIVDVVKAPPQTEFPRIIKAYLKLENPAILGASEGSRLAKGKNGNWDQALYDRLVAAGNDGAIADDDWGGPWNKHYIAFSPNQIKSADPVTYDDAGDVIPLSQRFRPTSPDIRRMAAEPRTEQFAGIKTRNIITTPVGITKKTTDVIRAKFFDSTSISPEKTAQAWSYISQFMDDTDNSNNYFAGYINNAVDDQLTVEEKKEIETKMGAALLTVELTNYAGKLAAQGDTKMLAYMIRNGNKMPTALFEEGTSANARSLNAMKGRLNNNVSGLAAFETEMKSNVERLAAKLFGTNAPSAEQIKIAQDALTESETIELGDANQVAADIKEVEGRTKTNLIDKIDAKISQAIDKSGRIKELEGKATRPRNIDVQAESVIESLQRSLGELPPLPQRRESDIRAIVKQDLRQNPDIGRREPWNNMLVGRLMQAGVSEEQAQTIAELTWKQHEQKAINRELKEMRKAAEEGSLAVIIDRIKNTSLERQQSPEWKQEVIKEYLRDAGLSSQAAETAAKLYDSVISERLAAAKQKAFEDTLAKAAPWKNYASRNGKLAKDALKKIKEAIRTGVLDPEKNTESIIAALSGWTGFTKEQYQRIVELDTILNDPNQDDITKREAMDALNKIITKAKMPVRFKDALGAYYIGNALMGIPTALVNIASPLGFSIRNLMVDIAKYAKENPAKIPVAFETFLDSMRSWYNQTAYAFKNQIYLNDVVEYLNGQNVLRETFDKGKKQWAEGKYAQGFANMAVGMTQITGRVLSALDQGAISMLENQNITRYAMSALENAKNKVPKNKVVEFANMTLDLKRRVMMESIAAGMDKDRAGVLADLAVKSELRAALSEYGADTQSVLDSAINDALQSVGRNKVISINGIKSEQQKLSDSGMLSYWPIKMLEKASEGVGSEGSGMQIFAKMVYGFALVPARTFHTAAWFSPYGFLRLAIDKYKKNKGYESPYAMSVQTDAQFRQRLTESIAGSIAMLGLFALRSGSSDEDEDKKFKIVITGNGPNAVTDKQYYDSWIKKYKPYSIHIVVGDTVIPINIGRGGEALFFPIMLAGALDDYEIKKKQNLTKKEPSDLNIATEMLGSAFFALAQRGPYAAFTEPLFDASKQGRVTENLVSQLGYFGKTFVPVLGASITRNISDFINDPVDRSSIEGALYANTPMIGPWIGTKALNALGQPIRADDFSDKLFKLGVPVVFSFPKNTPENALNELILKQGSGPTIPTRANAQKRFGDVLTDKEFETYVREYGRVMSDKMFKNRTRLANMKAVDYDDELEKYARGYSIDGIKIKGASDSAVLAVKRMRQ